jgi:hypothetical protein
MRFLRCLFSRRRWMLWLPLPISFALVGSDLSSLPAMLVGGLFMWIPYWFAWWLSDGFEGYSEMRDSGYYEGPPNSYGGEIYYNYSTGSTQLFPGSNTYRI